MAHRKGQEPIFSVSGIRSLEREAKTWSDTELLGWLKHGFALVDDPGNAFDAHVAFPPLRFHPESEPIGQLNAALSESIAAGLAWPTRIRKAALDLVQTDALPEQNILEEIVLLWHCMPALAPQADAAQAARRALRWIGAIDSAHARNALVESIVEAVSSAPANYAQFNFFRELKHDAPRLWRAPFVAALLVSWLDVPATIRFEAWCDLKDTFADDLRAVLDPETPAGRALIRTTSRRLGNGDVAGSSPASLRAWLLRTSHAAELAPHAVHHPNPPVTVEHHDPNLQRELVSALMAT